MVVGKKQSLCNVKMIVLSLECVALLSEVRMVYSFFKLYKMHEMEFLNHATIVRVENVTQVLQAESM